MTAVQLLAPLAAIAFLPLAAIIILLYLLKLRRRDLVVPSVFLWRRAVQDMQANTPFQKLRRNLLMLLQLIALACVIAGLAAPFFLAARPAGESVVIVLDASASMNATDAAGSRFEEAKRRAEEIAAGMGRHDEGALVVCGGRASVALPFSQDRRRLAAAIAAAPATDCLTNVGEGVLLALSLAGKRPDARVYVLSDGAFPPLPETSSPADIQFVRVGTRNDNLAVLAFEAARPVGSEDHQILLRVNNYAPEEKRTVVSIYRDEDLLDAEEMVFGAGETRTETFRLSLGEPGLLRVELEADDDLASDNVAYAYAGDPSAVSVLLVTPGNLFLEQALLVLPEVEVFKATSLAAAEAEAAFRDHDVVILDRSPVPALPDSGGVMMIGGVSEGAELTAPVITRWEENHPALRYVNLGAVQIARARAIAPSAGETVLAYAGNSPVTVVREAAGLRTISFGWDFLDSDLPLRVGFPVLLRNVVHWLAESEGRSAPMRVRPGTVVRLTVPPDTRSGDVTMPNGRRRSLSVIDGQATFADTHWVGVYRFEAGERTWQWTVDLRSGEESNLSPRQEVRLGDRKVAAGTGPPKVEQHLWPALVLLALGVLFAEWHLYHRRY